jgi:hypothetical protein
VQNGSEKRAKVTCGPDRQPLDGKHDGPDPYVSQAPQAVRSARGSGWDWALPASTRADWAFQTDKRYAVRLTVQVHGLRDISSAAAIRAVVRTQTSLPSVLIAFSTTWARNSRPSVLRYESRTTI